VREAGITLLGSGVCLGVYGPALSMHAWFQERGVASEVVVLEGCWRDGAQADLLRTKAAFHRDFRLAMMGQRMARRVDSALDEAKVTALLAGWKRQGRRRFVIFSGFWAPILRRFLDAWQGEALDLEICHMDAALPPSWQSNTLGGPAREVRLFQGSTSTISGFVEVSGGRPLRWPERSRRVVIHGGGWGLGTYREKVRGLNDRGVALDAVAYFDQDVAELGSQCNHVYMIDPEWRAWQTTEDGDHEFPPFGAVEGEGVPVFQRSRRVPHLFEISRRDWAIVSKPGGSSLNDSLAAATPLVLLEPYGDHERVNAELWIAHGLGIRFDEWLAQGCPEEPLAQAHQKLLRLRDRLFVYQERYLCERGLAGPVSCCERQA
jgi:hypothetical protein